MNSEDTQAGGNSDTNLDIVVVAVLPAKLDLHLLDIMLVHLVPEEVSTPGARRIDANVVIHPCP